MTTDFSEKGQEVFDMIIREKRIQTDNETELGQGIITGMAVALSKYETISYGKLTELIASTK